MSDKRGNYKHGYSSANGCMPTYNSWAGMIQRCNNPNNPKYPRYGGRGISVYPDWLHFENFLADMGERPENTSIDRIDVDGNYCKENCRWAPPKVQSNNRTNNWMIEQDGLSMTIDEWAVYIGIPSGTIRMRLYRGWPPHMAATTPLHVKFRQRKSKRPTELTNDQLFAIKYLEADTQKNIADKYGVYQSMVARIKNGVGKYKNV